MPINVPNKLPAKGVLEKENIFIMGQKKALHQDIRPLKIALLNLMPAKITTETQLLRLLSNTPLQVEIEFLHMSSHQSKNTPVSHLKAFYKTFKDIKNERFDGLIITGAPVEQMEFESVDYWQELTEIMRWAEKNVTSAMFLCWGAQAALYFYHGIKKYLIEDKIFGVFTNRVINKHSLLMRGFDEVFWAPHSRHTQIYPKDLKKVKDLEILAFSNEAGIHIAAEKNGKKVYVMGHPEYDAETLMAEYERDINKGMKMKLPENYFPDNNSEKEPIVRWKSHGFLLYFNWLNYFVYQATPYNWIGTKAVK